MSTVTLQCTFLIVVTCNIVACDKYNAILLLHAGSIIAGIVSDLLRARAVTSVASLAFAIPSVSTHAFDSPLLYSYLYWFMLTATIIALVVVIATVVVHRQQTLCIFMYMYLYVHHPCRVCVY